MKIFSKMSLRSIEAAPISPARPQGQANARIAQLVEQLAFNQLVLGSSPSPRTSMKAQAISSPGPSPFPKN